MHLACEFEKVMGEMRASQAFSVAGPVFCFHVTSVSMRKRATCIFYESDGKCSCECTNCCSKAFNGSLKYNTACFSIFLCGWASSSQFSIRWEAGFQCIICSLLTRRGFCTLVQLSSFPPPRMKGSSFTNIHQQTEIISQ